MNSFLHRRKARIRHSSTHASADASRAASKPPDCAAEKPHGDGFAGLPQATSAWIGALGITAGLAAAGFIGKLALQQFLGIDLGNWTALDLSIFAGRWAIDTLTIVLQGILGHPFSWGIPILLYMTPTLLSFTFPLDDWRSQLAARVAILLAASGLCFALVWCEYPTLSLNNWLTTEIVDHLNPPEKGILLGREANIRLTLLVSKMDGKAYVVDADLPEPGLHVCDKMGDTYPQWFQDHLKTNDPPNAARNDLSGIYAACVIIFITSLAALYLHQLVEQPTLLDDALRATRLAASLLLLPLVACLIPYMYGKLIYPNIFPEVRLIYKNDDKAKPKDEKPKDENPAPNYLIVDETDKDISLLNVQGKVPYKVTIADRGEISQIIYEDRVDVLNNILLQCKWENDLKQQ